MKKFPLVSWIILKAIDLIANELSTTMGLCGVNSIAEIDDHVIVGLRGELDQIHGTQIGTLDLHRLLKEFLQLGSDGDELVKHDAADQKLG